MSGTNIGLSGTPVLNRTEESRVARWFLRAAEQGNADAQYNLGVMYHEGRSVPQDYTEAARWFLRAAEQGNAEAQYNLGVMYHEGRSVPQDYVQAAKWFHKAAEQGSAPAQSNLGVMHANGDGVPEDYVQAYMWFSLSAAPEADDGTRRMRDQIADEMTADQLAEAQELVREWKPKK